MPNSDPVGTALSSIGAGASTGAAVMTSGVLLIRVLQTTDSALPAEQNAAIISASMFLGIFAAVATGWLRTRTIADQWRRGVTAAVSVFGAAILAVFATAADTIGGSVGLACYLVLLIAVAWATHRAAARAARP